MHLSSPPLTTGLKQEQPMNYELWLMIFGENVQREIREEGGTDCIMDDLLEQKFQSFETEQNGVLGFDELVVYGNLTIY